jgi:hypothetical protein
MTDANLHSECRLEIAKWLEHKPLTKIYNAILTIGNTEGYMPMQICMYRSEKDKVLYEAIRSDCRLTQEQAEKLISTM